MKSVATCCTGMCANRHILLRAKVSSFFCERRLFAASANNLVQVHAHYLVNISLTIYSSLLLAPYAY